MTIVFDEFKEIAKVPRPSFHEEMIRKYVVIGLRKEILSIIGMILKT